MKNTQHQELLDNNSRYLAVDYGTKITGLALYIKNTDPYPLPFDRLIYKSDQSLIEDILKITSDEFVEVIIVGVPKLLDGKATQMSKTIESFYRRLQAAAKKEKISVVQWDETLSTYEAQERMKNSPLYNFKVDPKKIDQVAACIILEDFLGFSSYQN